MDKLYDRLVQMSDDLRFIAEDIRKGRDVDFLSLLDEASELCLEASEVVGDEGICVGVYDTKRTTITWYRAHSLMRQKGGAMTVFALNDDRTPVTIPAKQFAGALSHIAGAVDILEWKR